MELDSNNRYRSILEWDLPEFVSKVDTPWDNLPDCMEMNAAAYRRIKGDLQKLNKARDEGRATSRGILILGEAGTGKTHLLMRTARNLARTNHILFVRRPNVEDAVAQHVWAEIVTSLAREVPSSGTTYSQLDDLLAHVFFSVLLPEFERDIREGKGTTRTRRWADALRENPYNLFEMLGEGESRHANMTTIRNRTLRYLQQKHPGVDQQIACALITYCFVSRGIDKRIILTWLSGQGMDEREAARMGLPPQWIDIEDEASDVSVQQRREEQALRAIRTIGILSTYFQPLILAFDQLEGLRGEPRLTQRWGDVVKEIFTMTPNILIVTCIYPSLWKEWFEPTLDAGVVRRISAQCVMVESFQPHHGQQLLEKQMEASFERHKLPTSTYPFATDDTAALCAQAKSPSQFIQAAEAMFNSWLYETDATVPVLESATAATTLTPANIDTSLQRAFEKFELDRQATYDADLTTEQDFFGRVHVLMKALLHDQHVEFEKAVWGHYVIPANFVIWSRQFGDQLCIAVLNSEGTPFTSRLRNFLHAARDGEQFRHAILLRDSRCNPPAKGGQDLLEKFKKQKSTCFITVDRNEFEVLSALYDTLVAIEEQTALVGSSLLNKRHLADFVARSGLADRSKLLQSACKWSLCVEQAMQSSSTDSESTRDTAIAELHASRGEKISDDSDGGSWPSNDDFDVSRWDIAEEDTDLENPHNQSAIAVLTHRTKPLSQVDDIACSEKCVAPASRVENIVNKPKVDLLLGHRELDSPHIGVLGRLRGSQEILGISLDKPQCIVLLGYMGSGKSYALGVLIENALLGASPLVQTTRPMTVVAFNYRRNSAARFEYQGFAEPNRRSEEVKVLGDDYHASPSAAGAVRVFGYGPELKRRAADYHGLPTSPIQFRANELRAEHWEILLKPPTPQSEYMDVIGDIIQTLYDDERLTYQSLEKRILDDDRLTDSQRKRAMNRLSFAARWLVDRRTYEWEDVLREGTLNVFDLRMQTLKSDEALKLCLIVTDLVRRTNNKVNKLIVFDEAHEYVDSKQLVNELENALTQIRHDGLSFVLASQFPERIPDNILRFFDTRFIFKLPTEKAITYLKRSAPNLKSLSPREVANLGLEKGICFVQTDNDCSSSDLRIPQILEVRPRCSQHGGATVRHS